MNLLLDTNILILLAKDRGRRLFNTVINPTHEKVFVSIASLSELKSIALQNKWGAKKWKTVNAVLEDAVIIEINENLVDTYAEIDAFSQCRNPSYTDYSFTTPRNMGKNDLWIATTAALLGLKLITTDRDFDHLHRIFIEVECLPLKAFQQL
ncbi:type II toxin-antitoxin system VapC family toxin [Parapedobacter sp. SGR-10]|uniref:type II toxin-antitoxin system VapC family toxin n=1 Tax=Parapedobacter sp. SGR-10 TaxID=2710879 RepID=UPI0013D2D8D4|nr:type II toxin-antitoxin system VapC family toxin [Parapedobacter sp. SGR-10]NGF57682.1 type II toxin-antitoxin system VapC family toxin [Parapedobacter sp. SGR-10]